MDFDKLLKKLPEYDLWQYLKLQDKPIVMYGMGNGADKIIQVCTEHDINISDFFASDGFVRGHSFHGKVVLSYSQICEKYGNGNFIILLSFASSLPDVINNIKYIASQNELYAPDVPVTGSDLFDLAFFRSRIDLFRRAYNLLADDESRNIFCNVVLYKLTGDISYLFNAESNVDDVFTDVLRTSKYRTFADLGAYNGDTIRQLLNYTDTVRRVLALEPDKRSYKRLEKYAADEDRCEILLSRAAAWDKSEILSFDSGGNRNSNVYSGVSFQAPVTNKVEIFGATLDELVAEHSFDSLDYIKYDVEGAEEPAILGSVNTINKFAPDVLISLYHRSEDLYSLPLLFSRIAKPEYKYYLRRFRYIPAWDLNLYCISND